MNIYELIKRVNLIRNFTVKMKEETVPLNIQKIILRIYADSLNFNLSDKMIDNILRSPIYLNLKN
jgi:hypothetical protein